MSYDDAMEGAKSNAIMRLGKSLGMFSELWDATWRDPWFAKNVEAYTGENWKHEPVKMYRRKTPEQMVPMSNEQRAELLTRMMKARDVGLFNAFNAMDEYWFKHYKHSFAEGLATEALELLTATAEKEAKEVPQTA
jgi:hypothetical protein